MTRPAGSPARAAARARHPSRTPARRRRPGAPATGGQRQRGTQVMLLGIVALLCLVGLAMVLSASSVQALQDQGSSWLFFRRQLLFVVVGAGALAACARVDYRRWRRLAGPLLALSVVLLAVVLAPGAGIASGGSTRWLGTGSLRVQPSELAKLGLVVFAADLLARRWSRPARRPPPSGPDAGGDDSGLRPVLVAFGVVAFLVLRQPDLGTTLVMGCIVLCAIYVAGTPMKAMMTMLVTAAAAAFLLGMAEPYRRARLLSFLNPWADADNTGYQVVQSLVGLGTGGVTGVGMGESRAKWGFLPNAHTDFVFTITGEELGLVGSLAVLALFVGFVGLGIRVALRAPDRFGAILAAGVTAWVAGQAVINIGAVVGALPVSGVPLPFVSYGGSSLVILMAAVGILLNVAGQGRRPGPAGQGRRPGPTGAGRSRR